MPDTAPLTAERLTAIRKRAEDGLAYRSYWYDSPRYTGAVFAGVSSALTVLHDDVPELLAEVERLTAALAASEKIARTNGFELARQSPTVARARDWFQRAETAEAEVQRRGKAEPVVTEEAAPCGCPSRYHQARITKHTRECSAEQNVADFARSFDATELAAAPVVAEATQAEERYCVTSGRAVRLIPGDRCLAHGAAAKMCTTALRAPECRHPHLSPNHPYPHCSECGRDLPAAPDAVPAAAADETWTTTDPAIGWHDDDEAQARLGDAWRDW